MPTLTPMMIRYADGSKNSWFDGTDVPLATDDMCIVSLVVSMASIAVAAGLGSA